MGRLRPVAWLAAAAAICAVGCGEEERRPAPREVAGPAQAAATVVERLDRALRTRDFPTVCDDLLAPATRRRAGGPRCAAKMRASARDVTDPRIRVVSVQLTGRRAKVLVRTRASGEEAVDETLRLERAGGGYRITALGR